MTTAAERLCLIIADISGYTGYLTGSELDHARDVMADLLETILGAMGPSPRLNELEGDAVFVNVPDGELDGSTLLDTLESCYFAFRRRVRSIAQATTCPCNACRAIRDLDLKFCVHTGEVVRQRIAGQEKLIGSDIILVHRLLKNSVADTFGLHAYILFTASCLERSGLDPGALRMRPHQESYEHFGQVPLYVHDLQARWSEREEAHRVFVRPEDADITMELSYPAPPPLVWEYLTAPDKRRLWFVGVTEAYQEHANRRRDVGTVIHCVHGPHSHVEEILDWRPFRSFTWVTSFPGLGATTLTFNLVSVAPGTRLQILLRLASPIPTPEARLIADQVLDDARASFDQLVQVLARHMEARTEQLGTVAEARATLRHVASGSRHAREGLSASRLDTQSHGMPS